MRRLPLAFTSALLLLACTDDVPEQEPTGSSGEASGTTTGSSSGSADTVVTTETQPTTDAPTTSVDSTGPVTVCGNGIIEEGEDCDDENTVEDDACYSNCTIPFEVLWTMTYDGGDGEAANEALFDADGNLYVIGTTDVPEQGLDLWLRQYTPEGDEGWTWTYDGALHGDDVGGDLAWHESGDLLIVGTEVTDTGDDVLVIRLAIADQTPVWIQRYDGPGSGVEPVDDADFGTGIATDPDGNVLVSGTQRVDGQEYDIWLREYDADGNELWTHEYDDPDAHAGDRSSTVLVDANGDVYLAGNTEISAGDTLGWVRKLDTDGNELWTETLTTTIFNNGSLDSEGNLVLAGYEYDNPDNVNMWLGKFDPDFASLGATEYDGPSGQFDQALGVAVGGSGDVYVTGFQTVIGQQSDIWVGRYMPDLGLRRWSDAYGNEDSKLADNGRGVAVSDDESRVAVVGLESVIGQDTNIWVRVYQNNPAPLAQ
jgi:cysteine-rich repeat protein